MPISPNDAQPRLTEVGKLSEANHERNGEANSDSASYAPIIILVDERADGVHLSYDSLASLIAPYGNREGLEVAKDLDKKIELLPENAAN